MRKRTELVKGYDSNGNEIANLAEISANEAFILPDRNWNSLIESYNLTSKKKFALTPLECRTVIELAKRSIPAQHTFEAFGIVKSRYNVLCAEAEEYEDKFQELAAKEVLNEAEFDIFHLLLRHPLRVLMADINRAEGISKIMDWERFNRNVEVYPDAQFAKMKARFKDYFSDKETSSNGFNVNIILGGDYIKDI